MTTSPESFDPETPLGDEATAAGMAAMLSSNGGDDVYVAEEPRQRVSGTTVSIGLVLTLAAGGLWLMYQRTGGPAAASAAAPPETAASRVAITEFLAGGDQSVDQIEQLLDDTEQVVQQFLTYPSTTQVPLSDLKTNPFEFEAKPVEGAEEDEALATRRAAEEAERLAATQREQALRAARLVRVSSIISVGGEARCVIDHRMYRVGEQVFVDGVSFQVTEVEKTHVMLRTGEHRFQLPVRR